MNNLKQNLRQSKANLNKRGRGVSDERFKVKTGDKLKSKFQKYVILNITENIHEKL